MAAAIVFLFTTASVFFLAFLALDVLHKAFEQYQLRYVTKSMNDLSDMFLFIEPAQILLLNVAALIIFASLGYWVGGAFFGGLAAVGAFFEPIARTIGERFRLKGKINALTSQGKLQGIIVSSLPLRIGLFFNWYRPDLMEPMFETAYGYILVTGIVMLEAAGFLIIRRIVA